jgi:hypothetical protein
VTDLLEVRNICVSIHRSVDEVYRFAGDGQNLPRWAAGLGNSVRLERGAWVANGPLGEVSVRFAVPNTFGVLDHDVTLASGETIHNPMRVVPNGRGSTVIFTLLRLPAVSARQFQEDSHQVERDLHRLKRLLERPR